MTWRLEAGVPEHGLDVGGGGSGVEEDGREGVPQVVYPQVRTPECDADLLPVHGAAEVPGGEASAVGAGEQQLVWPLALHCLDHMGAEGLDDGHHAVLVALGALLDQLPVRAWEKLRLSLMTPCWRSASRTRTAVASPARIPV